MKLQQIRQSERDERKEERREHILQSALDVFMQRGLDQTTMKDIADASEVGIATVFRYFQSKRQLAIDAAACLWKRESMQLPAYLPQNYETLNGISQFECLLEIFLYHYHRTPEVFRFLEQFDNFIASEAVSFDLLGEVENSILSLKEPIFTAIEKGKQDKSIRDDFNVELFYMTSMHTLMSIIQKFVLRGIIVRGDSVVTAEAQIRLLVEIICDYIRLK